MEVKAKPHVLIIDDDEAFNKIIAIVFKKFGLDVVTCSKIDEFYSKLSARKPDLCVIDLNLGDLGSGFDVVQEVRKRLGIVTPIFVVSGQVDRQSIAHAIEIGANDFIVKPISSKMDNDVLANKLSRYLESEVIRESKLDYIDVPQDWWEATLSLDFKIEEIDEFGFRLVSAHLIRKGTTVRVGGKFVHEVTGLEKDQLMTATSTWVNREGLPYGAYLEFEGNEKELMQNVRKWLVTHTKQ